MKNTGPYKHVEAFCLMTYATRDRSVREIIWNSRDGVTPFICWTRRGDRELEHIDWQRDVRAPLHVPKIGDRVWVDLTMERAIEMRTRYVERYWDKMRTETDYFADMTKEEAIRDLAHADMNQGRAHAAMLPPGEEQSPEEMLENLFGPPDLIVVDAAWLEALQAARRAA